MTLKKILFAVIIIITSTITILNSAILLEITGDYLFYSYDHTYVTGRGNIIVKSKDCEMRGTSIEIDVRTRSLILSSSCIINCKEGKELTGDMIRSDLTKMSVTLYRFGEKIEITPVKGSRPRTDFIRKNRKLLDDSLLYFVGRKFRMKDNFELTGYGVTVFIEGAQSLSFKKFRMDKGVSGKSELFSINNLWYTSKTGFITDLSFNYKKDKGKTKFFNREYLKLNYDLFKVRSDSPEAQFNIGTESTLKFSDSSSLMLKGGYITGNSGQASLSWKLKPLKSMKTSLTLDYRDRINNGSELWIRGDLGLDMKKAGRISLRYNHGKDLGYSGDITYDNNFAKFLSFSAASNISVSRVADTIVNRISDSRFSLRYTNSAFNLSANYSLNRDLINDNHRYSPGFVLNTSPLPFYNGLLKLNFSSSLLFNTVVREESRENSFRSNTALSITGKHLDISRRIFLDISGRVEQFFDSDPMENFTTAGIVLRGVHNISKDITMELLYNFHTRRETRQWLISGTSTGDISTVLRFKPTGGKLNLWGSVSYDTERGDYTTGFLNLRYNLIKYWSLQSFMNYDFEFGNLNYSIFLERSAGRILLRASYRSLSKQFQLEIIPR
ncbi:MAG: hypothetical protein ABFR36_03965 [Acidobacteriota bacterium]